MKKIFNYSLALFLLLFITSCDKGLDDLNKNRTTPTAIDPVFQLSNAVVNSSSHLSKWFVQPTTSHRRWQVRKKI